ncbi:MAG: hypothetical protein ACRDZR_06990 [Acidimicrobiales bacterium]
MLREVRALWDWADRDRPDDHLWRLVTEQVLILAEQPWAAPSTPLSLPTGQPTEIREMVVGGRAVITYEHEHPTGIVDLALVGSL